MCLQFHSPSYNPKIYTLTFHCELDKFHDVMKHSIKMASSEWTHAQWSKCIAMRCSCMNVIHCTHWLFSGDRGRRPEQARREAAGWRIRLFHQLLYPLGQYLNKRRSEKALQVLRYHISTWHV